MGTLENGGRVPTKLLKCIREDDDISDIDWSAILGLNVLPRPSSYVSQTGTQKLEHSDDKEKDNDGNNKMLRGKAETS
ncbi:hypothetical protein Tco_0583434 [Tanacetum coccineum]